MAVVQTAVYDAVNAVTRRYPEPRLELDPAPGASGAPRRWADIDAFVREVGEARIYEGIHYRRSTEIGTAMGRKIGELALERYARIPE
jgi:hypothetical protein